MTAGKILLAVLLFGSFWTEGDGQTRLQEARQFLIYGPPYFRPPLLLRGVPRIPLPPPTPHSRIPWQQLLFAWSLGTALRNNRARDTQTTAESGQEQATIQSATTTEPNCDVGAWSECSIDPSTCGTRTREETCNGVTTTETGACSIETGFRTDGADQWYVASNCYEYFLSSNSEQWSLAELQCSGKSAILVARGIRSETVRSELASSFTPATGSTRVHIGVRDDVASSGEGVWTWADGGDTSEPTNLATGGNTPGADCGSILLAANTEIEVTMQDCSDTTSNPFMCERAATIGDT